MVPFKEKLADGNLLSVVPTTGLGGYLDESG